MKIGCVEILLLGLCLVVLALLTLLVYEELTRWWTTRHDRRQYRRLRARFGRRAG